MEKIWIVYASCGGGHKKAAEAIAEKLQTLGQVRLLNILDFTNIRIKAIFEDGYRRLIVSYGFLWKYLFLLFKARFIQRGPFGFHDWLQRLCFRRFIQEFKQEEPRIFISTHFIPSQIASWLKQWYPLTRVVTCITDFGVHPLWVSKGTDFYSVASQSTGMILTHTYGVAQEKIWYTGIPLRSSLLKNYDTQVLHTLHGKPPGFGILLFSSYIAQGPLREIIERFHKTSALFVIYGTDKKLQAYIEQKAKTAFYLRGFSSFERIWELMEIVDIVVTKPGGLTVSECLAKHKPMVFMYAIYGQETENAQAMVEEKTAFYPRSPLTLQETIEILRNDPALRARMVINIENFIRRNHTHDFITQINSLVNKHNGC